MVAPDNALTSAPDQPTPWRERHLRNLLDSHQRLLGRPLLTVDPALPLAPQLWQASLVIVAHGTEADPILNYANRLALRLWRMPWQQFMQTPSRQTAEIGLQQARAELMRQVSANGCCSGYSGVRVTADGQRFRMQNATIWNLYDATGVYCGQAASFASWQELAAGDA